MSQTTKFLAIAVMPQVPTLGLGLLSQNARAIDVDGQSFLEEMSDPVSDVAQAAHHKTPEEVKASGDAALAASGNDANKLHAEAEAGKAHESEEADAQQKVAAQQFVKQQGNTMLDKKEPESKERSQAAVQSAHENMLDAEVPKPGTTEDHGVDGDGGDSSETTTTTGCSEPQDINLDRQRELHNRLMRQPITDEQKQRLKDALTKLNALTDEGQEKLGTAHPILTKALSHLTKEGVTAGTAVRVLTSTMDKLVDHPVTKAIIQENADAAAAEGAESGDDTRDPSLEDAEKDVGSDEEGPSDGEVQAVGDAVKDAIETVGGPAKFARIVFEAYSLHYTKAEKLKPAANKTLATMFNSGSKVSRSFVLYAAGQYDNGDRLMRIALGQLPTKAGRLIWPNLKRVLGYFGGKFFEEWHHFRNLLDLAQFDVVLKRISEKASVQAWIKENLCKPDEKKCAAIVDICKLQGLKYSDALGACDHESAMTKGLPRDADYNTTETKAGASTVSVSLASLAAALVAFLFI